MGNVIMEALRARGYAAGYTLCNPCDYYVPQIRHRIWMWGYRIDGATPGPDEAQQAEVHERAMRASEEVNPKVLSLLRLLEEPSALHFDDFMLPDDHPAVEDYSASLCGRRVVLGDGADRGGGENVKLTWQQKYTMHRA